MIVVDASAVVELLVGGDRAEVVLPWIRAHDGALHAPSVLDVEVLRAVRRLWLAGTINAWRGRTSAGVLQELPVIRHSETPLLPRIWELRNTLTCPAAAYVALAEALECPVLTCDERLLDGHDLPVPVEIVGR